MAYAPEPVPISKDELSAYLERELRRISAEFTVGIDAILLPTLYVAPSKPREGQVVLADGTSWNPGSGAGFYGYRGGSWRLLG